MNESEIEQLRRFSDQRAEALERMTKERDDLKSKLDVFQKSEVGWLREEYDLVHAKLAQVEADFAEERAKLTHVLTNTTEPGTLPYWQRKHDDLALKAFQLGVKLAEVEARCQDMIRERDDLLTELGAWHSQFQTSQLSHAVAERDTLRATAKRRLELLRKLDVFPCPICGGGITSHGSHKPDCPLAAELKEAGE